MRRLHHRLRHEDGARPLHVAVRAGQPEVVTTLLASKAEPRVRDHAGTTPLHLAAGTGDVNAIEALLDAGADPPVRVATLVGARHAVA